MEISDDEYNQRLEDYKNDLKYPASDVVHKHILTGVPVALSLHDYFMLRNRIAKKFQVQPVEVVLVGSCRVGFTLIDKPDRGRPRYSPLHTGSDLDIAVVSARLFDQLWQDVFLYSDTDRAFARSPEAEVFRDTLFNGWIDPRGFPPAARFARSRDWSQFFDQISADRQYGNRRASARVYRSWDRLCAYQQRAVEQCQRHARTGGN
jgi:predicted nucleotidyltransferase